MANEEHLAFPGQKTDIYDRVRSGTALGRPWFPEGKFGSATDINDLGSWEEAARSRIGNLVAHDGDRIEGADIIVNVEDATVTLSSGRIYVRGDVRSVTEAVLEDVPMTGNVIIGVRVASALIDHEDEPALLGPHEGTEGYGEDGAIRENVSLTWGFIGDGGTGDLYLVYQLIDGVVLDQSPPPMLSGVKAVLAEYDRGAHGNYLVHGCRVDALGKVGDDQVFSIGEGEANIWGFKKTRQTALRYTVEEDPDIETINGEPHTFADGGSGTAVITVNRAPINGITLALVTKEVTETIARGGVADTADTLSQSSVTEIISVEQGATTYVAGDDFVRDGNEIDWSPGGAEPATASSYDVTYRYLATVTPDALDARTVTLSGGVTGEPVFLNYTYKLPRMDRICLDRDGRIVYLKGISAIEQPRAPTAPAMLLSLAVVANDWFGTPTLENSEIRSVPYVEMWRYFKRFVELIDGVAEDRLRNDLHAREPVAKHGIFVDPFTSDRYRDVGEDQDAAVFQGSMQIAIDPTFSPITLPRPQFLDHTQVAVVSQEFITGCMKINPYMNFIPPSLRVAISPSQDRWVETNEQWLSPATQVFGSSNTQRVTTTEIKTLGTSRTDIKFLRQITVSFTLNDFGNGETLAAVTFDSIDVTPAGPLTAGEDGQVTGSFVIPANVTAGTKLVRFTGGSGREGTAWFTGEGILETTQRQEVTTILEAAEPIITPVQQPTVVSPVVATIVRIAPPRRRRIPISVEETEVIDEEELERLASVSNGDGDPLAQSFSLGLSQHVTGVDVRFCHIGDRSKPVICELVEMSNGLPTRTVIAQTEVDMNSVVVNTDVAFNFEIPVFMAGNTEYAFVFMTDDADHSLAIARRGGFDAARQQFVAAQPYTVGVLFSSSNRSSWTAHQDEDLYFRIRAARFTPIEKTIPLGVFAVTDLSDIIVDAIHLLPSASAKALVEIHPAGETPVRVELGQTWERQSFFTGDVTLRLILSGSTFITPLVARDMLVVKGKMRSSGTYVSRRFGIGEDVLLSTVLKSRLPIGSGLTVEWDAGDDDWTTVAQTSAAALADGSLERTFVSGEIGETEGRLRLTLTGTPAARPSIWDLRAWTRPSA